MSKRGKIILTSVLIAIVLALAVVIYIFSPAIKGIFNGNKYLTPEEGQELYDKGYADGSKNENELKLKINYYMSLVDTLQKDKADNQATVNTLKVDLQKKTDEYNKVYSALQKSNEDCANYKKQLATANEKNAELQEKYDLEIANNSNLKIEVVRLRNEKYELQLNLTNAQNRIVELNKTIVGYENFIQGLISQNQVVAKFFYKNSLYSVLVLQKGDIATVTNPVDTTYCKFLGWTVNNELVDVSNYPINENTEFIAKINNFFDVKFMVGDTEYDSDIVVDSGYSKVPTEPTKEGFVFDGWAIDNVVYNVETYPITNNTTFVAKFVKLNTVKFEFNNTIINTQVVKNYKYASKVTPELNDHIQFNYWTINGIKVDVENYPITSDVTFVANITMKYDVTFVYEDVEYSKQLVLRGECPQNVVPTNTNYKVFKGWSLDKKTLIDVTKQEVVKDVTYYALLDYYYSVKFKIDETTLFGDEQIILAGDILQVPETNPTKDGYEFDYWTLDNVKVNLTNYVVNDHIVFYAKFTKLYTVNFEHNGSIVNTQVVRENEYANEYTVVSTDKEVFNGWTLNGVKIILSAYPIVTDVTFVSDITYRSKVEFNLNGDIISTRYIVNGSSTTSPDVSDYTDYTVYYWTLDNSTEIVVSDIIINEDTVFYAKFKRLKYTATFTDTNAVSVTTNSNGLKSYKYKVNLSNVQGSGRVSDGYSGADGTGTAIINGQTFDVTIYHGNTGYTTLGEFKFIFTSGNTGELWISCSSNVDSFSFTLSLTPYYGISGL